MSTATATPILSLRPTRQPPATRSARDDVRSLPSALRSEWIKLSSLRSFRLVTAMTALLGGLTSLAVAKLVTDEVLVASDVFVYSTVLTAVLAATTGLQLSRTA